MEIPAWHVLLVEVLTFLLGALALWQIGLKPIQQIMKERRSRIENAQDEAQLSKHSAEALRHEVQARLEQVERDAVKRGQEAEQAAEKLRAEVLKVARKEALAVLAAGREAVKSERAAMRESVRQEVARLSLAMARKVAGSSVSAADRKRLFKKVLSQLPKSLAGSA